MKTLIASFVCVASLWGTEILGANSHQIAFEARELGRAASDFERAVYYAHDYAHLASDANRLRQDADRLASAAQAGMAEHHLQYYFDDVRISFRHLRDGHQTVQSYLPDPTVNQAWQSVGRAFHRLSNAMQGSSQALTTTVTCQSHNYLYQECYVNGTILAANVAGQLSSASCNQGSTWGFHGGTLWVNRGCRAHFRVTFRP